MSEQLPDQFSGSGHTLATLRHHYITDPIPSKRVCFYKSGDPQFNGLRMVINNRTFKTFDALLDSLSKKVPLPFGVRNITTPRGVHAVRTLDQLEDGKSYICSDRRKVKPINLVLASKKLPPWYHARPISARRRAVQLARQHPGRAAHKPQPAVVVRTPKRIMVFCNGDPSIRHTVMLQKKTTPTFESLLDYVSELMQFHVVKLHTPDGRRVDGLPALILCSGCVVAAGREPFKSADYNAQKSPSPTWLPTHRMRPRKLKRTNRKKKSLPGVSKTRNFSPSSERYFVNQIHNSIAGSLYDLPSNPTGSVELETVAETEGDGCQEDEVRGQDSGLPADDDIEKSFRVNQDGSMTVEMRVRLTIKEEESIRWTTTVTRSFVANELNTGSLPDPESVPGQENSSPEFSPLESQDSTVSGDAVNRKHSKDDDEPPSMNNGVPSEDGNEEDTVKSQTDVVSPRGAPTPGPKVFEKKQVSMESVIVTEEDMVGSYSYKEQRAVIEESCLVKHSSTKPVPKPRRVGSLDINNRNNRHQSTFKSARAAEILQIDHGGGTSTEAVLHVYEEQTCQDGVFTNGHYSAQGVSRYGLLYGRPATSDTARFSSANDCETELGRPSTASESIGIWRTDNTSLKSDVTVPSLWTGVNSSPASKDGVQKQPFPKPAEGKDSLGLLSESRKENSQLRTVNNAKRTSAKPNAIRKYIRGGTMSPGKRRKDSKPGSPKSNKKGTAFSSAAFLRRIYGYKPKPVKTNKQKQKMQKNEGGDGVNTESSKPPIDSLQCIIKDPNILSPLRENKSTMVSFKSNVLTEVSQPRGPLRRQPSMHQERKGERVHEDMLLPALNSSSSVINEYVEHWLEKSHSSPTAHPNREAPTMEAATQVGTEEDMSEMSGTHVPNCPPLKNILLPSITHTAMETPSDNQAENRKMPVKISADVCSVASSSLYRFSSASSLASEGRPASISPPSDQAPSPADPTSEKTNIPSTTKETTSLSRNPSVKRARLVSNLSFERNMSFRKASLDKSALTSDASLENTKSSTPIKIAVENTSPSSNKTQPSAENSFENTNSFPDLASQASSPSQCISASPPSSTSEERAFSASLSSDEAPQQTNISSHKTITQSHPSNQKQAASPKFPPKKTKLISDQSLERKLSIRKASSEISEVPNNLPLENTQVSSSPLVGRKPLNRNESLKSASSRNPSPDKNPSPNPATRKTVAPTSSPTRERLPLPRKADLKNRLSPYSQSLEVVSPPMKLKSKKTVLSKNLSLDNNAAEPANQALKTTLSKRKDLQATVSKSKAILPNSSLDKTLPSVTPTPLNNGMNDEGNKTDHHDNAIVAQEKPLIETQITPQPLKLATQLDIKPVLDTQSDIKPVLEELCYSIKSIRQITQSKRPSCLEKSNSLPDFSSHVASTFGSSSKALLAFLSVMTLKGGTTSLNMHELNANNVSCVEALRMIDSLREIASMEDADKLQASLADLQQSTSAQLLQSWKGFRELSDKCKSHSLTTHPSERGLGFEACSGEDCGVEENAIDELINDLDLPKKLKEELFALPVGKITDSDDGEMATRNEQAELSPEEKVHVKVPLPDDRKQVHIGQSTKEKDWEYEQDKVKCQKNPIDYNVKQISEEEQLQNAISLGPNDDKDIDECSQSSREVEDEESEDKEVEESTQACREEEDHQEYHIDKPSKGKPDNEYMYVKVCTKEESMSSLEQDSSEEERSKVECMELHHMREEDSLSNLKSHSNSEEEENQQPSPDNCVGLNISEESTPSTDVAEQSGSEEEQREVKRKGLQAIHEESSSNLQEEHEEKMKKELQSSSEERGDSFKGNKISLDKEDQTCGDPTTQKNNQHCVTDRQSSLIDNQDIHVRQENSSMIKQSSTFDEQYSFDLHGDSENDHSSCEEQVKVKHEQRSSVEDQFSLEEKQSNLEEEQASVELEESYSEYQGSPTEQETVVEQPRCRSVEQIKQSVAERISLLQKQVAGAQQNNSIESFGTRQLVQNDVPPVLDAEDPTTGRRTTHSPLSTSSVPQSARSVPLSTTSVPQSSLSFSYDSSGVITKEPEGYRVKSIKEMFLAKSVVDIQYGQRQFPSPNTSELSDYTPETPDSGNYQSQTSSELSSPEDDSTRNPITRGFVRRTIERLYGKKDANVKEHESQRPPSAQKTNNKDNLSLFPPFHMAQSKVMSDLSYLNAANATQTYSEPTRLITFNAKVIPGEPTDEGRWLLKESALIRKSLSDPIGINKSVDSETRDTLQSVFADTKEDVPYSLFSTKSEGREDKVKAAKCTYFSLPDAKSEADLYQDDLSTVSKNSVEEPVVERNAHSEETKMWAERNGILPSIIPTEFKMLDNKVHPLIEGAPGGSQIVVAQPQKGHGVVCIQEPDALDMLYTFCGQHCPIL